VDSSKFKAVNSRDRNFTPAKIEKRKQQIEESIQRYLSALDTADRTMPLLEFGPRQAHLKDKLSALRKQMRRMDEMKERLKAEPDEQLSLTDPDARSMMSQAKGTGWWATTCRLPSTPGITSSSITRSPTSAATGHS
jgi:hypothetical protein